MSDWDSVSRAAGGSAWDAVSTLGPALPRNAATFWEAFQAGLQGSSGGLVVRGRLPDYQVEPTAPWIQRTAAGVGGLIGDLPAMLAGGIAGAPAGAAAGGAVGSAVPVVGTAAGGAAGSLVGIGAGASIAPAVVREALTKHYSGSDQDVWSLAKVALKEGVIGAATLGAGQKAGVALKAAGVTGATATGARLATEVGTMVGARAALEWRLPEAHEFQDAATLVFGLRGVAAGVGKLHDVYRRTGVPPDQVLRDAQTRPDIANQLRDPETPVPDAYRNRVEPPARRRAAAIDDDFAPLKDGEAPKPDPERALRLLTEPLPERVPTTAGGPARDVDPPSWRANFNTIATSDDAKALHVAAREHLEGQARDPITWKQEGAAAGDWLVRNFGNAAVRDAASKSRELSAGELLGRKMLFEEAAEAFSKERSRVQALRAAGEALTPDALAPAYEALARLDVLSEAFLGTRAEAGRTLNVLKATTDASKRAQIMRDALQKMGTPEDAGALFDMLGKIEAEEGAAAAAARALAQPTWMGKTLEAYRASILSASAGVNFAGNGIYALFRPAELLGSAAWSKVPGLGSGTITFGESLGLARGMGQGAIEGARRAWDLVRHLKTESVESSATDAARRPVPQIEGVKGDVIRYAGYRFIEAGDALFRAMHEQGSRFQLAYREALGENLSGAAFEARVQELVASGKYNESAQTTARQWIFQAELGEKAAAGQRLLSAIPALQFIVPFYKTPVNIFKETMKFVPGANLLLRETRDALRAGGEARDVAVAKMAFGAAAMAYAWHLVEEGAITGGGPPDLRERETWREVGWQPYSMRVGNEYYSYAKLEPFASLIGVVADAHMAHKYMTADETDKFSKAIWFAFGEQVKNKTYLQGLSNFFRAMDSERYSSGLAKSFISSWVPAALNDIGARADPFKREAESIRDAVVRRIPLLREGLPPERDLFGEPVTEKGAFNFLLPVSTLKADDKVRMEAARLGVLSPIIPKKLDAVSGRMKGMVELDASQRDAFASTSGKLTYQYLAPIVNSSAWDALPDISKLHAYQDALALGRAAARQNALVGKVEVPTIEAYQKMWASRSQPNYPAPSR